MEDRFSGAMFSFHIFGITIVLAVFGIIYLYKLGSTKIGRHYLELGSSGSVSDVTVNIAVTILI